MRLDPLRVALAMVLLVLAPLAAAACRDLPPPRAVPAAAEGQWALASFNVWRLRDTGKDAPFDDPLDRQTYEARLTALAGYIVGTLHAPALLAVQEVENRAILDDLAARVRDAGGPDYRSALLEGNDPSGIDVGLLYRSPVRVSGVTALFDEIDYGRHALFDRPPLVVTVAAPLALKLVIVHLRSARELDEREWVAEKRRRQARTLAAWLKGQPGAVVVAGDFNSGPGSGLFAEPWRLIATAGLYNSARRLADGERYSYRHRCQPVALDHILLSPTLVPKLQAVAISRGNAGHYRALYSSQGTRVVSDHDVPVVYFAR